MSTARVTVVVMVCACACSFVKSYLTSGASFRPENAVMYLVGNGGRKVCGVFSETVIPELQHFLHCAATTQLAIFSLQNTRVPF